ncbi:O-antigen ligase family protein [Pseudomonas sp. LRF_L74]|uniref:O-antigen ligase family protein n=1 Tax=Pseudomonas sp. LRF_L74 TaxID=3369422 RepID=UPI003F609002
MVAEHYRNKLSGVCTTLLAVGFFTLLSGFLFNNDGSRHATQLHALLFLPALLLLINERLACHLWRQLCAYLLLALIGWTIVRGTLGSDADHPGLYWLRIGLFILLYVFAIYHLQRMRLLNRIVLASIMLSALFAWLTLYNQFVILDKPLAYEAIRDNGRLAALGWKGFADFSHPIVAGLYYGFFSLLLLSLLVEFELRGWALVLALIALAGLMSYLLLTFSRGAWFSTLASGAVLLVLTPKARGRYWLAWGTLALACMIIFFWPHVQNEWLRGTSQRSPIWMNWLERLPEFWLLGDGPGRKMVYRYPWGDTVYHAHSLYLQLWYEFGVVAITLFLALLGSLVLKAWRLRNQLEARVGLSALVFALVAMVSDIYAIFHRPSVYWIILWLPVGFLIALSPSADSPEKDTLA